MSRAFQQLSNMARQQSELASRAIAKPRTGEISSYDPNKHAVKVILQPEGEEVAGWIPLGAVGVGKGFGVATAPNIGDMVQVAFNEGDSKAPRIVGRFFSSVNMPPAIPAGETWIFHKSGSYLKFMTNGDVRLNTAGNLIANVAGGLTATVAGALSATVQGAASIVSATSVAITAPIIKIGATGQSLLQFVTSAMVSLFNSHTHTSSGSGSPTSIPLQTMGASQLTSTVQGG